MATVPFCNLTDAFPDWSKNKQNNNNTYLRRSIETDSFKQKVSEEQNLRNNKEHNKEHNNEINNDIQTQQQLDLMNLQNEKLPDLPTFTNATNCNARNNIYHNNVASDILRTNISPLNTGNNILQQQNMGNYYYPYNQVLMYPNNILPVARVPNMWPQHTWTMNPEGPSPYVNGDPYNKFFSHLLNSNVEHFSNGVNSSEVYVVSDMLQILIVILCFLFVIQLVDLVLSL